MEYYKNMQGSEQISKLIKSGSQVVGYELESGVHVSVQQAIEMAKHNQLRDIGVSTAQDGHESICSLSGGDEVNNLGNLPSISSDYK